MKITADVRECAEKLTDNEKAALYPEATQQKANGAVGATEPSYREKGHGRDEREIHGERKVYVEQAAVKEGNKALRLNILSALQ